MSWMYRLSTEYVSLSSGTSSRSAPSSVSASGASGTPWLFARLGMCNWKACAHPKSSRSPCSSCTSQPRCKVEPLTTQRQECCLEQGGESLSVRRSPSERPNSQSLGGMPRPESSRPQSRPLPRARGAEAAAARGSTRAPCNCGSSLRFERKGMPSAGGVLPTNSSPLWRCASASAAARSESPALLAAAWLAFLWASSAPGGMPLRGSVAMGWMPTSCSCCLSCPTCSCNCWAALGDKEVRALRGCPGRSCPKAAAKCNVCREAARSALAGPRAASSVQRASP
mmetsp:Transcript_33990/g.97775  ORF Transcript_33990/g.97775 Transcript_33990/m.97775 type:complete len:283 (+) Transcript_33990:399-1247(+)